MALFYITKESSYPFHQLALNYIKEGRSKLNGDLLTAINMELILLAVCNLEGVLEEKGKGILERHRAIRNDLGIRTGVTVRFCPIFGRFLLH